MYSVNILMFNFQNFLKPRACHCVIAMDEERGTELNKLQRLKQTHVLLHFALFMAHRAIPIIAFRGVESIYIYIYVCVTCATMRCIRS